MNPLLCCATGAIFAHESRVHTYTRSMHLGPAALTAALSRNVEQWDALTETLGSGGLEPTAFLASARASIVLLKPLGRCCRLLRRSMTADIGALERLATSRDPVSGMGALLGEAESDDAGVQALVWVFRGLSFATRLAEALVTEPGCTTTSAAAGAYDATLAPHHGAAMRTLYRKGTALLPKRSKLRDRVAGARTEELLADWCRAVQPALVTLHMLCAERG